MSIQNAFKLALISLATAAGLSAQSFNNVSTVPVGPDKLTTGQRNMHAGMNGPFAFTIYVAGTNGKDLIPFRSAPESWAAAPTSPENVVFNGSTGAMIYGNSVFYGVLGIKAIIFEDTLGNTYAFDNAHHPNVTGLNPTWNANQQFVITREANGGTGSQTILSFKQAATYADALAYISNKDRLSMSQWISACGSNDATDPGTYYGAQYTGTAGPGTFPYTAAVVYKKEDGEFAMLMKHPNGDITNAPLKKLNAMVVTSENGEVTLLNRRKDGYSITPVKRELVAG